jgi:hypothetical protein
VPIFIVLLLAITVVSATWWVGTRDYDFVTPPGAEKLAFARLQASKIGSVSGPNDLPAPFASKDGQPPKPPEPEPPKEPEIKLGSLETAPGLEAYAVDSQQGADHLIKLATALEAKGSFQRALLAWERVIDLGKAVQGLPEDDKTEATRLLTEAAAREPSRELPHRLLAQANPATPVAMQAAKAN